MDVGDKTEAFLTLVYHDMRAMVERENTRQDELWGGPTHDGTHAPEDWKRFMVQYGVKALLSGYMSPESQRRMIQVIALGFAACNVWERVLAQHASDNVLDTQMRDAASWGRMTFPTVSPAFLALRVAEEATEFRWSACNLDETDKGNTRLEAADILILLAHWASKTGVDLAQAVKDKCEINYRRKWDKDTLKHVPDTRTSPDTVIG